MADLLNLVATLGLDTSEFESALGSVPGIVSDVGNITGQLLKKAGAVAIDFAKDVLQTGLATDKALGRVYAVTNATEDYQRELIKTAVLQEAAQSTFDAAEVAMAAYYEGLAGYSVEEVAAGLHGIVIAAEASGESLQRVSDILTDTVTAFGDSSAAQTHYADVMAATATNANTTVGQMGQALKYVGPLAGALGYNIEEVSLTLGIMADSAVKGSQAGTTLRNIFTRIATNAGATTKDLGALQVVVDKLGVDFYDAEGQVRPWITVLDEMRASWAGMDEAARKDVANAFGTFSGKAENADEILKEFTADVEKMNEVATAATNAKSDSLYFEYMKQLSELNPSQYSNILDQLGIKYNTEDLRGMATALDQARIKLGLMGDEEKVYFAKQVGSMRGMSGFLALMTTSADKYDTLKESIYGAKGAADSMRDISLDNLNGDVEKFNAQLDVLKYAIFDDVKGPMRDVVQYATGALKRITTVIGERGLEGGIEQLGYEIEGLSRKLKPILESTGKALVPLFSTLINTLIPTIADSAIELGSALGSGIFQGIEQSLGESSNPLFKWLGGSAGQLVDIGKYWSSHDMSNGAGSWQGANQVNKRDQVKLNPVVDADAIQKACNDAMAQGKTTIRFGNDDFSVDYPEVIEAAVEQALKNGSIDGSHEFIKQTKEAADTVGSAVEEELSIAGRNGSTIIEKSLISKTDSAGNTMNKRLVSSLRSAGTTGGAKMADSVSSAVIRKGDSMKSSLASKLGQAGSSAGSKIANAIQSAINAAKFTANVIASVSSFFSGGTEKHAKSMYNGTVLRGATVFGVNANGQPLIGGESGPEAVIGVNSLNRTIANAVSAGMRGYAAANNAAPAPQQPMYLVLNGKVVGRVLASDNANAAAEYNRSIAVGYGG